MSIVTLNDRAVRSVTAFGSLNTGSMVFINKITASSSATIDFTSGIDSTYKEYIFYFVNIHAGTNDAIFSFQADTGTNTNYNQTIMNVVFRAYHKEDGSASDLGYRTAEDLAQSTSFSRLASGTGSDNDQSCSGYLHLFNPSSTTFIKHFTSNFSNCHENNLIQNFHTSGFFNITTAITRVRFKFNGGNIDAGDICLYGIL
jgi:hypothetical protein